jgi:radial spoke head protein 4A
LRHRTFENMYIGWGLKYSPDNFNAALPPVQDEFKSHPTITEADDPTAEEGAVYAQNDETAGDDDSSAD